MKMLTTRTWIDETTGREVLRQHGEEWFLHNVAIDATALHELYMSIGQAIEETGILQSLNDDFEELRDQYAAYREASTKTEDELRATVTALQQEVAALKNPTPGGATHA